MTTKTLSQNISDAITAHARWKMRLRAAIDDGVFDQPVAEVRRCDACSFGQWLEGPTIDAATRAGKPYEVIHRLHREFHEVAASVVEHAVSGRKSQAQAVMLGAYAEKTDTLMRALRLWQSEQQA